MHWRRKWQPTPVLLPGESQGWGNLVGAIYGVAQSRTRLKQLSSNSSWERLRAGPICFVHSYLPSAWNRAQNLSPHSLNIDQNEGVDE